MQETLTEIADSLGTDKGTVVGDWGAAHNYTEVYEQLLLDRRERPLNVLEIGVWRGASLRMWERFLPNAKIVGVDILPDTLKQASDRSKVMIGDAADPAFLRRVATTAFDGPIDFIVDDGSHALDHQVVALRTLFPFLAENGLYVVEDTAVSRFDLKVVNLAPFLDFQDCAAELASHTTFFPDPDLSAYNTVRDVNALSDAERDGIVPSYWNRWLHSVSFFYNMCVFAKRDRVLAVSSRQGRDPEPEMTPGAGWRARTAETRLAGAALEDGAGKILHRTADALGEIAVKVGVAAALARHGGSASEALADAVSSLDGMLDGFRQQLTEAQRESGRTAAALRDSRSAFDRTVGRLAKAEAEVEYLRQQITLLTEAAPAVTVEAPLATEEEPAPDGWAEVARLQAEYAALEAQSKTSWAEAVRVQAEYATLEARFKASWADTERVQGEFAVLEEQFKAAWTERDRLATEAWTQQGERERATAAAEAAIARAAEAEASARATEHAAAERVRELEDEVIRNAAELAQVRLIHGGLWESHRLATAELEACRLDGAALREDLFREREEAGRAAQEVERGQEALRQEVDELTGFAEWAGEEARRRRDAVVDLEVARRDIQALHEQADRLAEERDTALRRAHAVQADIGRLEQEADAARREADVRCLREEALLSSTSWRVMAPLRWATGRHRG